MTHRHHKWDPSQRAAEGAAYLDIVKPSWFVDIDASELNLFSPDMCVLGQTFEGYYQGLRALLPEALVGPDNPALIDQHCPEENHAKRKFAERFGFQVPRWYQDRGGYEHLGLAWKAEIAFRKRSRAVQYRTVVKLASSLQT